MRTGLNCVYCNERVLIYDDQTDNLSDYVTMLQHLLDCHAAVSWLVQEALNEHFVPDNER